MTGETLPGSTRDRVLRAAADLLAQGGREAVSTRAVSAAAGIQAPTLYRLFGDKDGLLAAVAAYGFEEYLVGKLAMGETDDPVTDLRRGWDLHVEFGLTRPAFYTLMYGDARPGQGTPAAQEATRLLHRLISRVAAAGRLRTGVERAAQLVHSAGVGVTLTLIATPPEHRDPELSPTTREAILQAVTTDRVPGVTPPTPRDLVTDRAMALRAALTVHPALPDCRLTGAEHELLVEWLDRLSH
ncbi:TetR/AcrR family transcriptional regulator [Sphaerisporangium aureirubrum]|uniref:TetR/AcrR family transcriptional regulator n=1 Tax=Sphaerisporangium aureirubrum TaxID=1544736 RepID=A0ABW1NEZ7_9ACTN